MVTQSKAIGPAGVLRPSRRQRDGRRRSRRLKRGWYDRDVEHPTAAVAHQLGHQGIAPILGRRPRDQRADIVGALRPGDELVDDNRLVVTVGNRIELLVQFDPHHHFEEGLRRKSVEKRLLELLDLLAGQCHEYPKRA